MSIAHKIRAFFSGATEHDRLHSWEHCYEYFHLLTPSELARNRHHSALQLGFYLASWGMYRASSPLFHYAYTAHLGVIDELVEPRFGRLWEEDFGGDHNDVKLLPFICEAVNAVRKAYRPFTGQYGPSDTLISKVLLGTSPVCRHAISTLTWDGKERAFAQGG